MPDRCCLPPARLARWSVMAELRRPPIDRWLRLLLDIHPSGRVGGSAA
jgi:hypothetical protein